MLRYPAQKIATNCLHGLSGNVMEDTFTIDLDTETIIYKGQTIFAFRVWTNIVGRAVWKYDESTGTLSLLLHAFQMGLMDATKHPIEVIGFQFQKKAFDNKKHFQHSSIIIRLIRISHSSKKPFLTPCCVFFPKNAPPIIF